MRRIITRGRGERGAALAESAVTLTMLLVLVFGIIDFGRAMFSYHAVANGARMGTRFALVRGGGADAPATQADVDAYVKSILTLDADEVTVTMTPGDLTGQEAGSTVRVQVDYDFQFLVPALTVTISSHSQAVTTR
jgi:Flp pilus assembly protein TadG